MDNLDWNRGNHSGAPLYLYPFLTNDLKGEREMAQSGAISRTAKKVIINIEAASRLISDVELDILLGIIKKIENTEQFMKQRVGK